MKLRLNKAHFPVTTLGPGRRIGLWLQGCSVRCPGCVSHDTWPKDRTREIDLDLVLEWCRRVDDGNCNGITISGGEPFEQAKALEMLLEGLHVWRGTLGASLDILCYSGLPLRRLQRDYRSVLAYLDALIPEPFLDSLPRGAFWQGSTNQPLVILSELGRERYASPSCVLMTERRQLQINVDNGTLWCIGIPDRGDLEKMKAAATARGIEMGAVSWRA